MIELQTVTNKTYRDGDIKIKLTIRADGSLSVDSLEGAIVALNNLRESLDKIQHEITKHEDWE